MNRPALNIAAPEAEQEPFSPDIARAHFSMLDLLRILRVRRSIILATAATLVVLSTLTVLLMTPRYSANAVVILDERKNNVEDSQAVLSDLPSDPSLVQNQLQILTSMELVGKVVDELKLRQDPEFNPPPTALGTVLHEINPLNWFRAAQAHVEDAASLERDKVIRTVVEDLSAEPIGLSTAMSVSFTSKNAAKAARIANAIADGYVEDQLDTKFEATQKATQWMSERTAALSQQTQAAEAAVQRYKSEHNITETAVGNSVIDQQIAAINNALVVAKSDLAEKQANYDRLSTLAARGQASNSADVLASPLVGALRSQESDINRQLADLSSKLGPKHPQIIALVAQKADLEIKLSEEIQRVVASVGNAVEAAKAHVASLQASLSQAEARGNGEGQAGVKLAELQSVATSTRTMYETFVAKLAQTRDQTGIQTADARVISKAQQPPAPSSPRTGLVIGISIPAGIMLGMMLAFAAERLDIGFRTAAQFEESTSIPVLSTLPEVTGSDRGPSGKTADLVIEKPLSAFAEAVRGLQLGLSLSTIGKPPQVVIVTSSVSGEGKTTLAVSLARNASRNGLKTVIVDGDLRRPNIARMIAEGAKFGLIEALKDPASVEKYLIKDERSNAMILPAVHVPSSPADVVGSRAIETLIARLRQVFDLVIIDSAPVLPVNDTKILSRVADAILFVVRWEKTPREAVANALHALRDVRAPVVGAALSRADNERFRYYSYGYQSYQGYDKYYQDKS